MNKYKLFIVEDDMCIAELIMQRAQMWNLDCRIAKNFNNILGEFAEYQPHIVLLDILLPADI